MLKVTILVTSLPFHRRSEDDHLRWEKTWTPKSRSTYVHWLASTPVSCSLVLAAAEGIIVSEDRTVLTENGGHVALTRG